MAKVRGDQSFYSAPRVFAGRYFILEPPFTSFSVPLVFAGRYFILEPGPPPRLSVFLEQRGEAIFEVWRNDPAENPVSVARRVGAYMNVTDKSGRFLYKVRPGSETSVAFGTVCGAAELEVRITDCTIVGTTSIANNVFDGVTAAIVVNENGSIGISAPLPASVVRLLK